VLIISRHSESRIVCLLTKVPIYGPEEKYLGFRIGIQKEITCPKSNNSDTFFGGNNFRHVPSRVANIGSSFTKKNFYTSNSSNYHLAADSVSVN